MLMLPPVFFFVRSPGLMPPGSRLSEGRTQGRQGIAGYGLPSTLTAFRKGALEILISPPKG
jgi:hypothetical protein